jgi:hypothetical protein
MGAMVDIQSLFRRFCVGVVPGREWLRLLGVMGGMGQGMIPGVMTGVLQVPLPVLAWPSFGFRGYGCLLRFFW